MRDQHSFIIYSACSGYGSRLYWSEEGNWSTQRKSTRTWGEYVNATQNTPYARNQTLQSANACCVYGTFLYLAEHMQLYEGAADGANVQTQTLKDHRRRVEPGTRSCVHMCRHFLTYYNGIIGIYRGIYRTIEQVLQRNEN